MSVESITFPTSDYPAGQTTVKHFHTFSFAGNLLDGAATEALQFVLPYKGKLTDVQFSLDVTGTDGTDVQVDVKDDATSMLTTLSAIAVAAAAKETSRVGGAAATGVTHAVIDATKDNAAENSEISIEVITAGTFTVQPRNAVVTLEFEEEQATDPAV